MAGRDTFDLEIFCGVSGEFEDFCGEVFEDGSDVNGGWKRYSLVAKWLIWDLGRCEWSLLREAWA